MNLCRERGGKGFTELPKFKSVSNIPESRNVGGRDERGSETVKLWRFTKSAKVQRFDSTKT